MRVALRSLSACSMLLCLPLLLNPSGCAECFFDSASSRDGKLSVLVSQGGSGDFKLPPGVTWNGAYQSMPTWHREWHFCGIEVRRSTMHMTHVDPASNWRYHDNSVAVPLVYLWAAVTAGIVAPLLYARALAKREAMKLAGLCVACGYDLRVTPDRCPECGVVPMK